MAVSMNQAFLATLLLATVACGSDLALPSDSGEGVDVSVVGGNGQTGVVGQELAEPLVVSVQAGATPIPGHQVAFIVTGDGAGRLEPDTAVSDSEGRAVAHWVLGSAAGSYAVEARLVVSDPQPPPTAIFEADAVAGQPDTLRPVSPTSQPGRLATAVADDPTVLVVDRFGNPVGGVAVAWDVTAGGGEVSSASTPTGADGRASVTWTLGLGIGTQKLVARVDGVHGSPATFSATVLF